MSFNISLRKRLPQERLKLTRPTSFHRCVHNYKISSITKSRQDIFPKLGEMGLLGVTVPEKWGGLGLGYLEHTIAMEGKDLYGQEKVRMLKLR